VILDLARLVLSIGDVVDAQLCGVTVGDLL